MHNNRIEWTQQMSRSLCCVKLIRMETEAFLLKWKNKAVTRQRVTKHEERLAFSSFPWEARFQLVLVHL